MRATLLSLPLLVWATVFVHAQSNLTITNFTPDGWLVFTGVLPGHHYALQQAGDLCTGWSNSLPPLADIQATGSTMTLTVPMAAPQQFYRIEDLGSCCTNPGGDAFGNAVFVGLGFADGGGTVFYRYGCGEAWFSVTALDGPAIGGFLNTTITLTSPTGADYDLYVYTSAGSVYRYSATRGLDRVIISIEDNPTVDQSRTWFIRVLPYLAYPCSDWQLQVLLGG